MHRQRSGRRIRCGNEQPFVVGHFEVSRGCALFIGTDRRRAARVAREVNVAQRTERPADQVELRLTVLADGKSLRLAVSISSRLVVSALDAEPARLKLLVGLICPVRNVYTAREIGEPVLIVGRTPDDRFCESRLGRIAYLDIAIDFRRRRHRHGAVEGNDLAGAPTFKAPNLGRRSVGIPVSRNRHRAHGVSHAFSRSRAVPNRRYGLGDNSDARTDAVRFVERQHVISGICARKSDEG